LTHLQCRNSRIRGRCGGYATSLTGRIRRRIGRSDRRVHGLRMPLLGRTETNDERFKSERIRHRRQGHVNGRFRIPTAIRAIAAEGGSSAIAVIRLSALGGRQEVTLPTFENYCRADLRRSFGCFPPSASSALLYACATVATVSLCDQSDRSLGKLRGLGAAPRLCGQAHTGTKY
jgi:hypothetical protein